MNDRRRRDNRQREETLLFSEKSERILIGAALQDTALFFDFQGRVKTHHFTTPRLARVWDAMVRAMEAGKPPTKTWVPVFIQGDRGEDEALVFFLNLLMNDAVEEGLSHAEIHSDLVFQLANKRRLLDAMDVARHKILTSDVTTAPEDMQDIALQAVAASVEKEGDSHIKTLNEWAKDVQDDAGLKLAQGDDSPGWGLDCGLRAVTNVIGRLLPGKVYVLAGMSGSGKSALAGQIVEAAMADAARQGLGWGYINSLEMTGKEYANRSLARSMGISSDNLESGSVTHDQYERMYDHVAKFRALNIEIDSTPNMTIDTIRSHMLNAKIRRGKLALGVIDHLVIVGAEKGENLFDKVSSASMKTKNIAKEFNIPMILLAQLTEKKVMETPSKWPNTNHLFGGETITQNSDVVAFIHRHEMILRKTEPAVDAGKKRDQWVAQMEKHRGAAHFFTDKRRGGAGGLKEEMRFIGEYMLFEDIS